MYQIIETDFFKIINLKKRPIKCKLFLTPEKKNRLLTTGSILILLLFMNKLNGLIK